MKLKKKWLIRLKVGVQIAPNFCLVIGATKVKQDVEKNERAFGHKIVIYSLFH